MASSTEQRMLKDMIYVQMSQVDRKAIGKVRQFSADQIESLALFSLALCSNIGLEQAFAQLDDRELACLHLMMKHPEDFSIEFFTRLYRTEGYGRTFTQIYGDVFTQVRKRLIRNGVLFWSETGNGYSKLERYRFALPQVVIDNLPPLIRKPKTFIEPLAVSSKDPIREQLTQMLKNQKGSKLQVDNGNLILGGSLLNANRLQAWQDERWLEAVYPDTYRSIMISSWTPSANKQLVVTTWIHYGLSQLNANEWVEPEAFKPLFELDKVAQLHKNLNEVFKKGWENGCLDRIQDQQTYYYRLRKSPDWQTLPIDYLAIDKKGVVNVDVEKVPHSALPVLTQLGNFRIHEHKLQLIPSLAKLSEMFLANLDNPIVQWLSQNSQTFADVFQELRDKWGSLLVHKGLLYARVNDLSLRVVLEKTFTDGSVLFMPNGWMAFPEAMERKIKTVVNRKGHAVKEVSI